jgi:hypothetical protein
MAKSENLRILGQNGARKAAGGYDAVCDLSAPEFFGQVTPCVNPAAVGTGS